MSRIKKTLLGAAAVLGLSIAGVAVAVPANAAAPAGCAYTSACWWDNAGYTTAGTVNNKQWFYNSVYDMGSLNYSSTGINAGNSGNSAYNNGATSVAYFYDLVGYGTPRFQLSVNTGDSDFGNGVPGRADGYFNNRLSSAHY